MRRRLPRHLSLLGLLALFGGCECDERKQAATHPGFSTAGVNATKPSTEQTAAFVKEATAEATHLDKALPRPAGAPSESYFALRRAVAAASPYFRPRAKTGAAILLGPVRSVDGDDGALGELDRALTQGDEAAAREALAQVIRALRRIDNELTLEGVPPEAALRALSDAAYHLGLRFAEAYPGVPASPRAVLADLRGHLDGMAAITRAVMRRVDGTPLAKPAEAPSRELLKQIGALRRRLDGAADAHALIGRAQLIVATGALGVAARQLAVALGAEVKLPHLAQRPQADNGLEEPVHALLLPDGDAGRGEPLAPGQSPLDRFARGEGELTGELQRGFDLFVGKARCARCHVPPFFGGARPPDFSVAVYAVLGLPETPEAKSLDDDPGRGEVTERPRDRHAFETPSIRNLHRTAPYFHHGGYPTLADVVDFYDRGGGTGLGLEVPNQDPDVVKLDLSPAEKQALLAFLERGLADPAAAKR